MQILVLDACSRDHTIQFARAAGANVIQREWTDFVDARTFALSQVTTPWTLMIDADEALDDVLCASILSASGEPNGYRLRRTTYFCGKPMRVWRNELLLRLFRTGRARLQAHPAAGSDAAVHEGWVCDGPAPELPGTLLHYSYPDVSTYRIKYDRYTSIEAKELPPSLGRRLYHGGGEHSAAALAAAAQRRVARRPARLVRRVPFGALSRRRGAKSPFTMSRSRVGLDARMTRQMSVGMKTYAAELAARLPRVAAEYEYVAFSGRRQLRLERTGAAAVGDAPRPSRSDSLPRALRSARRTGQVRHDNSRSDPSALPAVFQSQGHAVLSDGGALGVCARCRG